MIYYLFVYLKRNDSAEKFCNCSYGESISQILLSSLQ